MRPSRSPRPHHPSQVPLHPSQLVPKSPRIHLRCPPHPFQPLPRSPHPSPCPPPSLPASPQVPPSLTCWLQDSGSPAAEPGPAFQGAPGLAPPREGRPRPAPAAPRSTPGAPGRLLRGGPGVQGGTHVCTDTYTHTCTWLDLVLDVFSTVNDAMILYRRVYMHMCIHTHTCMHTYT